MKYEIMTTTQYTFGDYNVSLALDENKPLGKLNDLHICHLGMKFVSARPIPEFSVYDFEMSLKPVGPGDPVRVKCCGIVVSSQPEDAGYRTIIHFSGLCKNDAECLEVLTKANKMRCEYCANC